MEAWYTASQWLLPIEECPCVWVCFTSSTLQYGLFNPLKLVLSSLWFCQLWSNSGTGRGNKVHYCLLDKREHTWARRREHGTKGFWCHQCTMPMWKWRWKHAILSKLVSLFSHSNQPLSGLIFSMSVLTARNHILFLLSPPGTPKKALFKQISTVSS